MEAVVETGSSRLSGARLVFDPLLQVIVEVFVGIVFGRIGRQIENLDVVFLSRQPRADFSGVMHSQVVHDEKDFPVRILCQAFHETYTVKVSTFSALWKIMNRMRPRLLTAAIMLAENFRAV